MEHEDITKFTPGNEVAVATMQAELDRHMDAADALAKSIDALTDSEGRFVLVPGLDVGTALQIYLNQRNPVFKLSDFPDAQPKPSEGFIDIVFDGPPGPTAGRFVEVEDASGKSINFGDWVERGDGYWALRIPGRRRDDFLHFISYMGYADLPCDELERLRIAYEHGATP